MSHLAACKIKTGTMESRVFNYYHATKNSLTAEEVGGIMKVDTSTIRRRLTDLKKKGLVNIVGAVKGETRAENVYQAA